MATILFLWWLLGITREHLTVIEAQIQAAWAPIPATASFQKLVEKQILKNVVQPTMGAFGKEGWKYRGFLYFGLMLTASGPKVLEFNCRLGDPETQAIIPRIDSDLGDVLMATAQGQLRTKQLKWRRGASICVVMASGGYPGKYEAGQEIHGLEKTGIFAGVMVFHAGTRREGTILLH